MKRDTKTIFLIYGAVAALPVLLALFPRLEGPLLGDPSLLTFLAYAPYAGFLALAFLGWNLNQIRIFLVALCFLAAYALFRHPGALSGLGIRPWQTLQILSISLPCVCMLIFLNKEGSLWGLKAVVRVFFCLLPFAALAAACVWSPAGYREIVRWNPLPGGWPHALKIPLFSFPSAGLLVLAALLWKDHKTKIFVGVLLINFLPFFCATQMNLAGSPYYFLATVSCFTTTAGTLLYAVFVMYWKKVYVDELTEIPNRRALDERLQKLAGNYMLAMMDIDHFKKFNDLYGHDEGDNVLRLVASHLNQELGGRTYRYGGEEFCAVFEEGATLEAVGMLEAMRSKLAEREFHVRNHPARRRGERRARSKDAPPTTVNITLSAGVAGPNEKRATPDKVIKRADECLYQAKEKGRNCVVASKD